MTQAMVSVLFVVVTAVFAFAVTFVACAGAGAYRRSWAFAAVLLLLASLAGSLIWWGAGLRLSLLPCVAILVAQAIVPGALGYALSRRMTLRGNGAASSDGSRKDGLLSTASRQPVPKFRWVLMRLTRADGGDGDDATPATPSADSIVPLSDGSFDDEGLSGNDNAKPTANQTKRAQEDGLTASQTFEPKGSQLVERCESVIERYLEAREACDANAMRTAFVDMGTVRDQLVASSEAQGVPNYFENLGYLLTLMAS